jgi:hypothetical protein
VIAKFFGQYLVERRIISATALEDALAYQAVVNVPLGALALSKGLLSEPQVLITHTEQRKSDKKFGEIAVHLGFLKRSQLDELLREQAEARILIGEALVQKGHLTRESLEGAFEAYRLEQARAEAEVRARLADAPRPAVVEAAVDVSTRVLLRLGGVSAKLARVAPGEPLEAQDHAFWQRVEGDVPFVFVFSLATPTMLAIAARMLETLDGAEVPMRITPLVVDVVKEFTNLLVAQLCARLSRSGERFDPGAPDAGPRPPEPTGSRVTLELALPQERIGLALDV